MSALPPARSASSDLAAVAAKPFPGGNATHAADSPAGNSADFAAHFQRLLEMPLGASEAAPGRLPISPDNDAAPADELAALLPFIEALGLTQGSATPAAEETDPLKAAVGAAATLMAAPASLPTASPPPNTPAISAGNPAEQGKTHGLAFGVPAQSDAAAAETPPTAIAGNDTPAETLPAGREFSAQLVAAIAASKETPHTPGTTAAAVQNIVAQAAPGRSLGHETAPIVTQAVGSPGWTEEIGNRVAWLANQSESKAELILTPPQMGRIEISLALKGEQATASFVSGNPAVREALEAALPRLREVLADAGIQLGQAQVSAEHARQWVQQEKHGGNSTSDQNRGSAGNTAISSVSSGNLSADAVLKRGRGLVDVFA